MTLSIYGSKEWRLAMSELIADAGRMAALFRVFLAAMELMIFGF